MTKALEIIEKQFGVDRTKIENIKWLKKGMTNNSFVFECRGEKYIMRIPGVGTDRLINREQEYLVYQTLKKTEITDFVIYLNPENGYKITKYIENARCCDPYNEEEVHKCMERLKELHSLNLKLNGYEFDLFNMLEFYESLRGEKSIYCDYEAVKNNVLSLKEHIECCHAEKCLSHIDAVPDNFLFTTDRDGKEKVCLIDWEYAGMQDPHVDIAMFGIYAMYDKRHMDSLIDIYFGGKCKCSDRIKIYCYVAVCGLLWSNWCEYKRHLGIEFGEYAYKQYEYAKDYYWFVMRELESVE